MCIIVYLLLYILFNISSLILYMWTLSLVVSINTVPFLQSSYFIDIYQRNSSNEFLFSNLFFFWTSLWYLYFAIFLSLLIFVFSTLRFSSLLYLFWSLFYLILILTFFAEMHNTVNVTSFKNFFNFSLNKLLHNGTNKIHPFILYMSLSCFTGKLLLWIYYFNLLNKHVGNIIVAKEYLAYYRSLLLIVTALSLGCWWALQEGSWGGWWNWDISEVFGLLIFYKITVILHSKLYWSSRYFNYWYSYIASVIFITFYLIMQINFELSAHDFGFKWLRFPTKEYLMYLLIVINLYVLASQVTKFYSYLNILSILHISSTTIKITFIYLIISIIIYVHIVLIGMDIYSVKILMEEKTVYNINFSSISFILVALLISINLTYYTYYRIYLILLNWNNVLLPLLLCFRILFNSFYKTVIHLLILVLALYVFCTLTLITTHWISIIETSYKLQALNISPDSNKLDSLYNFINRGIKTEIRTFKLFSKINQLQQEFLPAYQYREIIMQITDYSPLTLIGVCLLIMYTYILFLQQIIIF